MTQRGYAQRNALKLQNVIWHVSKVGNFTVLLYHTKLTL